MYVCMIMYVSCNIHGQYVKMSGGIFDSYSMKSGILHPSFAQGDILPIAGVKHVLYCLNLWPGYLNSTRYLNETAHNLK